MTTNLTPQQKFEERIKAKLVDDIGELLPDEVLSGMVESAMKEAFFKPRKIRVERSYGGGSTVEDGEPWLIEVIRELVDAQVKEQAEKFLAANADHMKERLDEIIKNGLLKSMIEHMDMRLGSTMNDVVTQVIQRDFPQRY